jgi:murein DD-endopeptidase MepM/ murein hydrolase activator NlpD/predicted chitinase
MAYVEARLENYPPVFRSGYEILSCEVTLGQDDKNSTARVTIADTGGKIAGDLIAHTIANGGIVPLPNPQAASGSGPGGTISGANPKDQAQWESLIMQQCQRSGVTDPAQIAYLLATAKHETGFVNLKEIWGPTSTQLGYEGRSDLGNNRPGDGKRFLGRGLVQVTGRTNYTYWSKRLGQNFLDYPEKLESPEYAVITLVEGCRDGTFTTRKLGDYVGNGRKDFEGARAVVNGSDRAALIAGYAEEYLKSGKIGQLGAASTQAAKVTPAASDPAAQTTSGSPEVKGSKLSVVWGGREFVTYHQGTKHKSPDGTTTLEGVGIRWQLNRRPRNRTLAQISLKQLAEQVSKAQGVALDWQAPTDIQYEKISQQGLSDYAFLRKQCDQVGFFLGDSDGKLTVKSLNNIQDTQVILVYGRDMLSIEIEDKALDPSKTDNSTVNEPSEPKTEINPVDGKLEQKKPDVDKVKDTSTTGKDKPTGAEIKPESQPLANAESGAKKRLRGLPTKVEVPTTEPILNLEPLSAIRTKGLHPTFNRVWAVDKVSHKWPEATSTLEIYSPVEAIVTEVQGQQSTQQADVKLNPSGLINPLPGGVFTSPYGPRGGRFHGGVDLANNGGNVVAAASGTIMYLKSDPEGYGDFFEIKHDSGWSTLYGHMERIDIKPGQRVTQGQVLGKEGQKGRSSGIHLHFEVYDASGTRVDPAKHIVTGPLQ